VLVKKLFCNSMLLVSHASMMTVKTICNAICSVCSVSMAAACSSETLAAVCNLWGKCVNDQVYENLAVMALQGTHDHKTVLAINI
jgi:hypothetical protein